MNLLPNNMSNIPLHCDVCPKRPDFSDVSHLLTHVASKGHLSNYYKMKVKASTDASAKKVVDEYDEWYEEWNLEGLMRERMIQKEKKRGSASGSSSRRGAGATTSTRSTPCRSAPQVQRSTRLRDNMQLLDPQLSSRYRTNHLSRSGTPASNFSLDSAGIHRSFGPAVPSFPYTNMAFDDPTYIKQEGADSSFTDDSFEGTHEAMDYQPPCYPQVHQCRRQSEESLNSIVDMENLADELANDNSKLKGIFWPGMNMFDSATPEMRRKRNQKKNVSVLMSLQATSEVVAPTECVFDTEGVLRKERLITGNPDSDDSLIEGESEPEPEATEKKRVRRRSRPALQERSVNSGRALRSRAPSHHPPTGGRRSGTPYANERDGEDDDLTFGQPRTKRRTGLSIHRDNSGPDITFDQPNYLAADFRRSLLNTVHGNVFPPQPAFYNNHIPRAHARQSSWGQLNVGFRPITNSNANGTANHSLPNFGTYLNHSIGQSSTANSSQQQHSFGTFQPQFHDGQLPAQSVNSHSRHPPPGNVWDYLGFDSQEFSLLSTADTAFHGDGTMISANPLFLSSAKEDDEVTISAKSDS